MAAGFFIRNEMDLPMGGIGQEKLAADFQWTAYFYNESGHSATAIDRQPPIHLGRWNVFLEWQVYAS
ncbi:MAG: hypothetical protein NTX45_08350 [Proteobacteria bacterium]|nr:hypothetical protein [Pseudomonadota bacterium]